MTELEQFTPDSDAAPARIVLGHPQNQLLELGIETWPTRGHAGDRRLPAFFSPTRGANPAPFPAGPASRPEPPGSSAGQATLLGVACPPTNK